MTQTNGTNNPRTIPELRELSITILEGLKVRDKARAHIYDQLISLWEESKRQYTKAAAPIKRTVTKEKLEEAWMIHENNPDLSVMELCERVGISGESQGRVSVFIKEKTLGHKPARH